MVWYEVQSPPEEVFARFPSPTLEQRYTFVMPDGSDLPVPGTGPVVIPSLGHGGFGAVVRAKDRIELPRAIKLLDPTSILKRPPTDQSAQYYSPGHTPTEADAQVISAQFQEEIRYTNARPFKHILPIIDYGLVITDDNKRMAYYVSPFVPGQRLDHFLRSLLLNSEAALRTDRRLTTTLHELLLSLIDDLLAALGELQDAQVSHMDVKAANLMVLPAPPAASLRSPLETGSHNHLFLIDLGAAKSAQAQPKDRVPLVQTPYYFPQHLMPALEYRDGTVNHSAVVRLGPVIDLYATGRTLEYFLLDRVRRSSPGVTPTDELRRSEPAKERKWRIILEDDFAVVEGLVDRLMRTDESGFPSATHAQLAFQTIARHTAHSVLASRALTDQTRGIRIPVGSVFVRLAPPFDRVINHPVFQRLRRLQQLALLSEDFPDATHTRFAHSLRTFDLAKQFVLGLNRDINFRLLFTQRDVDHVLATALLHDIGQYPFSHTIEDLRKLGDLCQVPYLAQIRHDQELAAEYLERTDGASMSIKGILEDYGYSIDAIIYMFQKTPKDTQRPNAVNIGRDLISGVIDVDRVSYLLHDSARTGVPYGGALDVERLVEALCIYHKIGGLPSEGAHLGIEEAGLSAVEAVLTAVYWMYRNVYWRHTNRGFMAAVKHVMETLIENRQLTFEEYVEAVYGRTDWDALAYLHERYSAYGQEVDREVYNPLDSLMKRKGLAYERVFSLGFEEGGNDHLYELVIGKVSPRRIRTLTQSIAEVLPKGAQIRDGEILIDVPLKKRLRAARVRAAWVDETQAEAGARPDLWVRKRGRAGASVEWWEELHICSPLARTLGSIEDHSGRKIRVFMTQDLIARLPDGVVESVGDRIRDVIQKSV